jgi:hypothetical protein
MLTPDDTRTPETQRKLLLMEDKETSRNAFWFVMDKCAVEFGHEPFEDWPESFWEFYWGMVQVFGLPQVEEWLEGWANAKVIMDETPSGPSP